MMESSEIARLKEALGRSLESILYTREYVGEELLPAIEGWGWYDSCVEISQLIPDNEWSEQFRLKTQPCPECNSPNPRHTPECLNASAAVEVIEGFDVRQENSLFAAFAVETPVRSRTFYNEDEADE